MGAEPEWRGGLEAELARDFRAALGAELGQLQDRLLLHYARGLQALRGEGPSPAPPGAGLLACAGGGADDASAAAYSVAGGPLPGSFAPPARAPPRLDGRLASEPGCPFWCERETKARQHRGPPRKRKASSASPADDAPPGPEGGLADGRGPAREGAAALALEPLAPAVGSPLPIEEAAVARHADGASDASDSIAEGKWEMMVSKYCFLTGARVSCLANHLDADDVRPIRSAKVWEPQELQIVQAWSMPALRHSQAAHLGAAGGFSPSSVFVAALSSVSGNRRRQSLPRGPTLMFHSFSRERVLWGLMGAAILGYDLLAIPLLAFDDMDSTGFLVLQLACCLYWVLDICISFRTAYIANGVEIISPSKVAVRYLHTWFPVDFAVLGLEVVTMTFQFLQVMESGNQDDLAALRGTRVYRIARFLRIMRVLRMVRLVKVSSLIDMVGHLITSDYAAILFCLLKNVLIILILSHYVACGWYFVGTLDGMDASWVDTYLDSEAGVLERYTFSLHWSLTQFTPSTNNICPQSYEERAFAMLVVLFALLSFSSFLSAQTNAINQLRMWNQAQLKEESRMRQFFGRNALSLQVKELIWQFQRQHFSSSNAKPVLEKDVGFFAKMPEGIRIVLHNEMYAPVLESNAAFAVTDPRSGKRPIDLDTVLIAEICHDVISEMLVAFGQEVFVEGSQAALSYYVSQGSLTYDSHQIPKYMESVPARAWVSEVALWAKWSHMGTLRAASGGLLLTLNCATFQAKMAASDGALFLWARKFAIFLCGYADRGNLITDLPIDRETLEDLSSRAMRISKLNVSRATKQWFAVIEDLGTAIQGMGTRLRLQTLSLSASEPAVVRARTSASSAG